MKGVIEKIWQNKTKDKKDYWVLTIGGENYSVWDKELMEGIVQGNEVDYGWLQSGEYKKITDLKRIDVELKNSTPRRNYKDRQIVRMSCLKSAADLVGPLYVPLEEKTELTLGLARKFEKYVTEEDIPFGEDHEKKPGQDG